MRISDWSSDVCSSDLQFARRLVEHRFDKAFRFAQRYGLAVADEGEFADLDLISGFLCLGFRQADAGDLGMAISAARDVVPIHRMGMRASDMFDRNNAFMARLVRQPGPLRAVADRIDAGNIATAIFVGLDMGTLVAFDPQFLQTDMLQIGHDTHRHDDMAEFLGRDLAVLALDLRGYAFASRRDLLNTG